MLLLRLFIEKRIDEPVHHSALLPHQRTGRAAFLGPEVVIRKQTEVALNQGQRRAQLMAEQPQSANSGRQNPHSWFAVATQRGAGTTPCQAVIHLADPVSGP